MGGIEKRSMMMAELCLQIIHEPMPCPLSRFSLTGQKYSHAARITREINATMAQNAAVSSSNPCGILLNGRCGQQQFSNEDPDFRE
jgi:hypothetical protein